MSTATNTIIVTSKDDNVLEQVEFLKSWLLDNVLKRFEITAQHPIQFIILQNFERILIISPNLQISQKIMSLPMQRSLHRSYSHLDTRDSTEYLQVPKGEKMFLISPPSSPPPEFDYSRCEEPPSVPIAANKHLAKPASGYMSAPVTILNSNIANIIVNPCVEGPPEGSKMETYNPTAMPPRSIFDDNDEDL